MARQNDIPEFEASPDSDLPIWVQICDRFTFLIVSGYYKEGDKLPSVRAFSAQNRVSCNTVSKAYMTLEREGLIATKHGSGVYVRGNGDAADIAELEQITEQYIKGCKEKGASYDDIKRFVNAAIKRMRSESDGEQK